MLKIRSKLVMLMGDVNVTLANGSIQLTAIYQFYIDADKEGNVNIEVELIDYNDVSFLGMKVENGYKGINKIRTQLSEWGIDFDKAVEEESNKYITEEFINKLKRQYASTVG